MFLRRFSPLIRETLARRSEYWNSLAASAVPMRGSCGVAPGSTGGFCCAFTASPWAVAIAPARAKKDLRVTAIDRSPPLGTKRLTTVSISLSSGAFSAKLIQVHRERVQLLHHAGRLLAHALHPSRIPTKNIAGQAGDVDISVGGQRQPMPGTLHGAENLTRRDVDAHDPPRQRVVGQVLLVVPVRDDLQLVFRRDVHPLRGPQMGPLAEELPVGIENLDAVVLAVPDIDIRSEEHTSELQALRHLV